jgi:uncharacterized protein (TIGR03067 family)
MYRTTAATFALVLLLLGAETGLPQGSEKDDPKTMDKLVEGVWEEASLVRNGKEVEPLKKGKRVASIKGENFTVRVGEEVFGATIKLDPTKTPKAIDFKPLQGPNKGLTALGIYEVKGDELRICYAEVGKERPAEFGSKEGSHQSLRLYKRLKQ